MVITSSLQAYNLSLMNIIKKNKLSLLAFSSLTIIGYLSLPFLERYQKLIQKRSKTDNETTDNEIHDKQN